MHSSHESLCANVEVLYGDGTYTVVVLSAEGHQGVGVAKRHPADVPDLRVGQILATGRAFKNLGDTILSKAEVVFEGGAV